MRRSRSSTRSSPVRARENNGIVRRSDLTGFNWADVPAILVETGFMTNPREGGLLRSAAYQQRVARGLADGVSVFVGR